MQLDLLKKIAHSIAGEEASKVVAILYNKKNVNEFDIAKKLGLTINQTRNLLYKLSDEGMASFIRKKDRKKGGWYTYFWTLNSGKGLIRLRDSLEKEIKEMSLRIKKRNSERFFICKMCGGEFNEEDSLNNNYTCPECGEILDLKDSTQEIELMHKEIQKKNQVLEEVNAEISEIVKKVGRTIVRKAKAEAKKKSKERAAKRVVRDGEKKSLLRMKRLKKLRNARKRKKLKSGKAKKVPRKNKRGFWNFV